MQKEKQIVNIGSARSVADLSSKIGSFLKTFSRAYVRGDNLDFKWYLGNLIAGHINVTALVTFLSVSNRIRQFKGSPIDTIFEWRPKVFTILHDLGFFEVAEKLGLLRWDSLIVENFEKNILNPRSLITFFADEAPDKNDLVAWKNWKDEKRKEFYNDIKDLIEPIFDDYSLEHDASYIDLICKTTAELSVNCIMHGKEFAFVGIQVFSGEVLVSICDSGIGFKKSISRVFPDIPNLENDLQAIVVGSLINPREIGLYESINEITNRLGAIEINSYAGEVYWTNQNWGIAKAIDIRNPINLHNLFGQPAESKTPQNKVTGYYREIRELRGTRITFKIPVA